MPKTLTRLLTSIKKKLRTSALNDFWYETGGIGSSQPSTSGAAVNQDSALQLLAVWSCIKVISESLATLPWPLYRRLENDGRERAQDHPLYTVLHDRPNPEQSSFSYRQTLAIHLCTWGNHYAVIERDVVGRVQRLWPLRPDRVRIERVAVNAPLQYVFSSNTAGDVVFKADEIFHIKTFSRDGVSGMNPISVASETLGLGIAQRDYGARLLGTAARPSVVLRYPGELDEVQQNSLRNSWNKIYGGSGSGRLGVGILEEGMDIKELGFPPETTQFIESRKFTRSEVAGFYRVPLHKIGDLDRATFSNIEHQAIEFATDTLLPYVVAIDQEVWHRLLTVSDQRHYFSEMMLDGLLRGDFKTRVEGYRVLVEMGAMNSDEGIARENLIPIPDGVGKTFYVPLNWTPAGERSLIDAPADRVIPDEDGNRSALIQFPESTRTNGHRSATERRRLAANNRPLFEAAGLRIVSAEIQELTKGARKTLGQRDASSFEMFIDEFYSTFGVEISKNARPILGTYGEQIQRTTAMETGLEISDEAMEEFLGQYEIAFIERWINSSKGQLRSIVRDSMEPLDDVTGRLGEWGERRAVKYGRIESVNASGAIVVAAYKAAGVRRKTWVTFGRNCPFCDKLRGKTVQTAAPFVAAGNSVLAPQGGKKAGSRLRVTRSRLYPPIHDGCDCGVAAA